MIEINGVELEFDAYDADQVEKIEKVSKKIDEIDIPEGANWSQIIRIRCEGIFNFFDTIFGEDTAYKIFEGKTNLKKCNLILAEFLDQAGEEIKKTNEEMDKRFEKFSPNRSQRRTKK